jgi:hypothetical protein
LTRSKSVFAFIHIPRYLADDALLALQNIHYDMEDLIDQANEIQETLGRTYGVPDEVDEADLEAGESIPIGLDRLVSSLMICCLVCRTRGPGRRLRRGRGNPKLSSRQHRSTRLCRRGTGSCTISELCFYSHKRFPC